MLFLFLVVLMLLFGAPPIFGILVIYPHIAIIQHYNMHAPHPLSDLYYDRVADALGTLKSSQGITSNQSVCLLFSLAVSHPTFHCNTCKDCSVV
jgi:hypothetical protein